MNNDLPLAQLTAFKQLTMHPFMTVPAAIASILNGVELTADQQEHVRDVLLRLQDDGHQLGYAEAMGWL